MELIILFLFLFLFLFFSVIGCLNIDTVFAHIPQENKTLAPVQEWKNARDSVKIQFSYSPERPLIYTKTDLRFSIQHLTTGNHIKDLIASITIIKNDRIFFKSNNVEIQNGDLSLKVRFLEDGSYQVISQIRSADNLAVALASFDILVPLQPIGTFNVDSLSPLLIPAALVVMGLSVSVIVLILISRRNRRAEKTTG
jgi:hypothetical protein